MKEYRRQSLQSALDKLRRHHAPEQAWDQIVDQLEEGASIPEENGATLQDGLKRMATYRAPGALWGLIADRMDRPYQGMVWRISAVAASIVLLMGIGSLVNRNQSPLPPMPVAETRLPDATHLAPAEGVSYPSQWQSQWTTLQRCLPTEALTPDLSARAAWQPLLDCKTYLDTATAPSQVRWQDCQALVDSLRKVYCDESPK